MEITTYQRQDTAPTLAGKARRPVTNRRPRFDNRTNRAAYIIGAALRHYHGAEKAELLQTALRIQEGEVWS